MGLDALLQAVRLAGLADDEGVQPLSGRGGCMEHRRGNRVGAQVQASDRVVGEVSGEVAHDDPDEGARLPSSEIRLRST